MFSFSSIVSSLDSNAPSRRCSSYVSSCSSRFGERLVGFNTENEEINEGLVRFDLGSYEWKGNLDLLNIIMLGLAKNQIIQQYPLFPKSLYNRSLQVV